MTAVLIIVGLLGLFFGGEALVRGAVAAAERFGVPPLIIGLTLVGFGTSTPELVTSLEAALSGADGIAVGNVVGSNTANILLILGLAAIIAPIAVAPAAFRRDGTVLAAASLLCLAPVLAGGLGRAPGAGFAAILAAYVLATIWWERRSAGPAGQVYAAEAAALAPASRPGLARALLTLAAGLAGVLIGAKALVAGAIDIAAALGVPDTVIGLTIVAVGTSLPELVTSALAARRGQSDIAFGNIVGSNIFNILGILGITALVSPLTIPASIAAFDIWVMLGATFALFAVAITGWRVTRAEGAALLVAYAVYVGTTLSLA